MLNRRSAISAMGAAALAQIMPAPLLGASGKSSAGKLSLLREGDTVGLVAPAGFVGDRFGLEQIEDTIRAMGLVPKSDPHMLERHGYLAGTDRTRAAALQTMFEDDAVRAIFAVRGGWGSARLLPYLDFSVIRSNPKLLVGSSDITALHLALAAKTAMPSIHGPNAAHSWPQAAWQSFRALTFDGATPTYAVDQRGSDRLALARGILTFRSGKARGRLLGGNLSVLSAMVGTPWLPDFGGAILFLEDTNEAEYRIDRMLTQLGQSGLLARLAGVVFGQCTNCRNPGSPYGNFTLPEVLDHHFGPLGIPAFQGARIGHISQQVSIPVGIEAEIDASAGTIRILEPVAV